MGRLIAIMGNSGVGKTTLARQLCRLHNFTLGLEQHIERPYQRLFSQAEPSSASQHCYALANQVDYLLLRAEQEHAIRQGPLDGLTDGGLEMDFHVFTRLFQHKGYLDEPDFALCERLYNLLRKTLPAPDLIIYLDAPLELISQRFARRGRPLEIARLADLALIQDLLQAWRRTWKASPILTIDASIEDPGFEQTSQQICKVILTMF